VFSGLTASTCLWWLTVAAFAQQDPAATPPQDAAPAAEEAPADTKPAAADETKYDPPLTDKAKVDDWQKKQNGELRFKEKLKLERLSNADKEILTGAVQNYLYRLTLKEERQNMHTIVQKLLETVNSKALTLPEPRNFVNDEIVRIGPELLGQHPDVRLNLLILAASLISDPNTNPPRPFAGATPLFLNVLDDPAQPPACKIWAVKGLTRICRDGDIPITQRDTIATHLVDAVGKPDAQTQANWFYRLRLMDALGATQLCYNLQRQPTIIDTLIAVLSNRRENWLVRATAASSVTQIPWQAADQVNVPLVTYLVCDYAREVLNARNAQLNAPHWKYCVLYSYLSFNPATAQQKSQNWGLMQKVKMPGYGQQEPLVHSAYQALLPAVNTIMGSVAPVPVPPDQIKALDDWLKNNIPDDKKATPSSKQIDPTEQRGQKQARVGGP
jgi:hypothetical protein